ncbi:hypothetical protein C9374_004761 [Naegleria lovaniensis]|uniref:PUM-HD domain-containing protein n=1 Tax=Naegleria lovaniensis TaxID=51637 RepID=A0AA88GPF4_NAELO|nr:uncharacterized protein C9374_004761 [Naegleria lovaniensis]KAG2382794.1 hypothetical protein C9374_004761 [Naegleria lovaniensis]
MFKLISERFSSSPSSCSTLSYFQKHAKGFVLFRISTNKCHHLITHIHRPFSSSLFSESNHSDNSNIGMNERNFSNYKTPSSIDLPPELSKIIHSEEKFQPPTDLVDEYIQHDEHGEAYYNDLLQDLPPHLYFDHTNSTTTTGFSHELDREYEEMFKFSSHSSRHPHSKNQQRSSKDSKTPSQKSFTSHGRTKTSPQTSNKDHDKNDWDNILTSLHLNASIWSAPQPELLSEQHEQSLYLKEEFMQYAQQAQDELLKYFYMGMDRATRARLCISDLKGHLHAFAIDKYGSAFISNCLQVRKTWISKDSEQFNDLLKQLQGSNVATDVIQRGEEGFWITERDTQPRRVVQGYTDAELDLLFEELKPHFDSLLIHVFGKFIVYHFLKVCTPQQRLYFAQNFILGHVDQLLSTKGGSMICERLFELLSVDGEVDLTQKMLSEIENRISALIWDPIAQYFIRAIAEFGTISQKLTILKKLKDQSLMEILKTHQPSKIMEILTRFPETRRILIGRLSKKDYVELACNVYGAFFIVGCMKFGSVTQRRSLISSFTGNIFLMALNASSSFVLNHAFRAATTSEVSNIVNELQGHFLVLSQDRYANFLMKQILCLTNNVQYLNMAVQEMRNNFALLSYQRYSSRVVEYVLNLIVYYSKQKVQVNFSVNDFVMEEFSEHMLQMAKDRYAAYTVQLVLQIAFHTATAHLVTKETKTQLMKDIWAHSMNLALDPFGCHVIQYLVRNSETRMPIMRKFLETEGNIKEFNSRSFFQLLQNKHGVSVVIELIKHCNTNQRNALFNVMNSFRRRIEESPYSKPLIELAKSYDELGLFSNKTPPLDMFPKDLHGRQ